MFCEELEDTIRDIPIGERTWLGGDLNGHVGKKVASDGDTAGQYGMGERNKAGENIVKFASQMNMAIMNTYFKKDERHKQTHKSGGSMSQVDYTMCRGESRKECKNCTVILGESVTNQHRPVVGRLEMKVKKQHRAVVKETKTKWWNLKKAEHREKFVEEILKKDEMMAGDWEQFAGEVRAVVEQVLGRTSGKRKEDKEDWWWDADVQGAVHGKRVAKKEMDKNNNDETKKKYKEAKKWAKRAVARAKAEAYQHLYKAMETPDGLNMALRIAKQRSKNSKDITQPKIIKDEQGNKLKEDEDIKSRWHRYFCGLLNEENERVRRESGERKIQKGR